MNLLFPGMRRWIIPLTLLAACSTQSDPLAVHSLPNRAGTGSSVPHLASAGDGTIVMSWLESRGDGHRLLSSTFDGKRWSPPGSIAEGKDWFVNWADFPSVVPISDELWAAHWLAKKPGGTYAYDVAMSISRDGGASWSEPVTPHTDGTPTEHGFVSLFPWHGSVGAVWLDGRNMLADGEAAHHGGGADAMTLRFASLTADGAIAQEALIDDTVCDCCQTDVALTNKGPIAVFRNRTAEEIRDISLSRALGETWSSPTPVADDGWHIAGCPVNGPAIAAHDRHVAVAWFTGADGEPRVRLAFSSDAGQTFQPVIDIDTDRPMGRVDVELLRPQTAVVSWMRNVGGGNAEVCLRRVTADGSLGSVHVITRTEASRPAGFPQMLRHGDDLVFAWTEVEKGDSRVRTATVPIEGLQLQR